jgi:hypothetical protein
MTGKSWYERGYDGVTRQELRTDNRNRLLMIPESGEKEVAFLDDQPCVTARHSARVHGEWTQVTCTRLPGAGCCRVLGQPRPTGYLSVVDLSDVPKDRESWRHALRLGEFSADLLGQLRLLAEAGTLAGHRCKLKRSSRDASWCGDSVAYVGPADMAALFQRATYQATPLRNLWAEAERDRNVREQLTRLFQVRTTENGVIRNMLVPFAYAEILKPPSPAELTELLKGSDAAGTDAF